MTPEQFIAKWGPGGPGATLNERQGAQPYFVDLCQILNVPTPGSEPDYLFEKDASLIGEVKGYADVFKRGFFAWENKAPGKNLDAALRQLLNYSLSLANPPLLVVCDRTEIRIHTQFNGHPSETHRVLLQELTRPEKQQLLRHVWTDPESFRPRATTRDITEAAARSFANLAERLRGRSEAPDRVAHFLTQCLFCFFAEDVGLLPGRMFERLVNNRQLTAARLTSGLAALFETMRDGGLYGPDEIPWFNGGLFRVVDVPLLADQEIADLRTAAGLNWSAIDVSIFGTLFERGLDPKKRSQLGAHYTDPATIMRLIEPTLLRPAEAAWHAMAPEIAAKLAKSKKKGDKQYREARAGFVKWLEALKRIRVLDPACGSGNFLFLALKALKDLEYRTHTEAGAMGLDRETDLVVGPANLLGIELNEYAAELARVTIWIGELQWRIEHGYPFKTNPVLEPLDNIACTDALLDNGVEAQWPQADVLVGNPPFLGDKRMRGELGGDYVDRLRAVYAGRVPGGADLVAYWFDKARASIEAGQLRRAGLVATNSIRGGRNREVLERICKASRIFEAWSDEAWVNEGAAVRVSLVAFGQGTEQPRLDGHEVSVIYADLTAPAQGEGAQADLTRAHRLAENKLTAFNGIQKTGPFDIPGRVARQWIELPANANGARNCEVVAPYRNGIDIVRRPRDMWIVDFGWTMSVQDAAMYEEPFRYARETIYPVRAANKLEALRRDWWRLWRPRPEMREQIGGLPRYLVTLEVAKHRVFTWLKPPVLPDKNLVVIARADDVTFGVLQSRIHVLWSLRQGTSLEDRPRYTPSSCFETFPFPPDLTPRDVGAQTVASGGLALPAHVSAGQQAPAQAIAEAAHALQEMRERWLNPPEWTQVVPEACPPGMAASPFPPRIEARPGFEADLAKRTLTNLYNTMPAWLKGAHQRLDSAVARAYGWTDYTAEMPDSVLLERLLALNLVREPDAVQRLAEADQEVERAAA